MNEKNHQIRLTLAGLAVLLVCWFIILSCSVWNNSMQFSHTSAPASLAFSHYRQAAVYWRRWKRQISWFALSAARFSCTKTTRDVWIYARAICMWKSPHAGPGATQSRRCLSCNGLARCTSGVLVRTSPPRLGCRWNLDDGVLGRDSARSEGDTGGGVAPFVGGRCNLRCILIVVFLSFTWWDAGTRFETKT